MSASQRLKVSVVQTQPPQPRAFCSACVSEFQTIFVFGGRVAGEAILSELIVFDPATVSWSTPATAGTAPKREHHAACFVGSKMIVVGGWDGNKRQNDVWMLDTLSTPFTWSKVEVGGRLAGHSGHSLTYLPSRDEIVVVGRESGQRRYSDTHALSVKRLGVCGMAQRPAVVCESTVLRNQCCVLLIAHQETGHRGSWRDRKLNRGLDTLQHCTEITFWLGVADEAVAWIESTHVRSHRAICLSRPTRRLSDVPSTARACCPTRRLSSSLAA
eukprot:TRINITY_DN8833_c0_g1_i1.p1 TRINITY_DN8833_c0_g1~~TRINITY_DN8833_c0_g1_i1.p1  ORF type:complete len:272 (+),score=8.76 TRINITY_DN8833_c0_g1_i1:111-926(+)